jgi:hypothetical protein
MLNTSEFDESPKEQGCSFQCFFKVIELIDKNCVKCLYLYCIVSLQQWPADRYTTQNALHWKEDSTLKWAQSLLTHIQVISHVLLSATLFQMFIRLIGLPDSLIDPGDCGLAALPKLNIGSLVTGFPGSYTTPTAGR